MTPHNEAKIGEIASTVIMPGDPLRAKMIAEKYLKDYKLVNKVRNNYAYTGYYNNKLVTIMSSGMGMPSMGIYAYELYNVYGVDKIIRVGTAGSYSADLKVYDTILAESVYSESNYALVQSNNKDNIVYGDLELNNAIKKSAEELGVNLKSTRIHSTEVFYKENNNFKELNELYGCMAVEMESFALFTTAKLLNKKAACILTISDSFVEDAETTPEERQNNFTSMIEVALNTL